MFETPGRYETDRGNYLGEYPPVYYAVMRLFAGPDLQVSALVMRLVNAVLFVGLATALAALLPAWRRGTLLWGWLVTLVPLGMFIIPSNNPSGWAVTGVGTAFLALLGWFEIRWPATVGARRALPRRDAHGGRRTRRCRGLCGRRDGDRRHPDVRADAGLGAARASSPPPGS